MQSETKQNEVIKKQSKEKQNKTGQQTKTKRLYSLECISIMEVTQEAFKEIWVLSYISIHSDILFSTFAFKNCNQM